MNTSKVWFYTFPIFNNCFIREVGTRCTVIVHCTQWIKRAHFGDVLSIQPWAWVILKGYFGNGRLRKLWLYSLALEKCSRFDGQQRMLNGCFQQEGGRDMTYINRYIYFNLFRIKYMLSKFKWPSAKTFDRMMKSVARHLILILRLNINQDNFITNKVVESKDLIDTK